MVAIDDADISQEKAALRKSVIARRNEMNPAVRAQKSAAICREVVEQLETTFGQAGCAPEKQPIVGLFSALGSEVVLCDVVRHAQHVGWRIALPVMVLQEEAPGYTMLFVGVDYKTALLRQEAFLAKPAKNLDPNDFDFERFPLVSPDELDALVMPLVAFDSQGGRLGYGGGNYDRYLPQLRKECWVSGVAFDEQCVPRVPRADFDLAIPQVIHA